MFESLFACIREQYPGQEIIPLHEPRFNGNEQGYLAECIESTMVSSVGAFVGRFEAAVADYTGARHAIAVVNGTQALFVALKLAGVTPQSEVLTQSLTFVATANAISYCGATPHFIDIDSDTLGLSPSSLAAFLERETKIVDGRPVNRETGRTISACLPMHTCGHPCRIDEISEICAHFGLPLVEDAAESLGSTRNDRHTGTFGRLGTLSFNGNKIVTCGGGGMILTDDDELASRARHLTTTAKQAHPYEFIHDEIGYNFRMPNLNAALGLAQLEQLESFVVDKRALAICYRDKLSAMPGEFVVEPEGCRANFWLNTLLFEDDEQKDSFLAAANSQGIGARSLWRPMHLLDIYSHCPSEVLATTEDIYRRAVNIPSSVRRKG